MATREQFQIFYDEFRTLVLNKEYYARRMAKSKRILRFMDIFLALFAGGSGVLSFGLWKFDIAGYAVGPLLLSLAAGVALVLGIARPYLKLEDEHQRLASIQGAYDAIAFAMEDVVTKIKREKDVDEISEEIYRVLRQVRSSLSGKEDTPSDRELISKLQSIVNQRYPPESYFYYPTENNPGN